MKRLILLLSIALFAISCEPKDPDPIPIKNLLGTYELLDKTQILEGYPDTFELIYSKELSEAFNNSIYCIIYNNEEFRLAISFHNENGVTFTSPGPTNQSFSPYMSTDGSYDAQVILIKSFNPTISYYGGKAKKR